MTMHVMENTSSALQKLRDRDGSDESRLNARDVTKVKNIRE